MNFTTVIRLQKWLDIKPCNLKRSSNLAAYKNDTELSKEFWKIKGRNSVPQIMWRILRKCSRFHRSSLRCNLCLNEKPEIAWFKRNNILNNNEFFLYKYHITWNLMEQSSKFLMFFSFFGVQGNSIWLVASIQLHKTGFTRKVQV